MLSTSQNKSETNNTIVLTHIMGAARQQQYHAAPSLYYSMEQCEPLATSAPSALEPKIAKPPPTSSSQAQTGRAAPSMQTKTMTELCSVHATDSSLPSFVATKSPPCLAPTSSSSASLFSLLIPPWWACRPLPLPCPDCSVMPPGPRVRRDEEIHMCIDYKV